MGRWIIVLMFLAVLIGCESWTRSPAEKSTDPEVIEAVAKADAMKQRAKDTSRLVLFGSIALIGGIAFRFISNAWFPKSTGIGVGVAAGGAACLAVARIDPTLQRVAFPAIVAVLSIAVLYLAAFLYLRLKKKLSERSNCKMDHVKAVIKKKPLPPNNID